MRDYLYSASAAFIITQDEFGGSNSRNQWVQREYENKKQNKKVERNKVRKTRTSPAPPLRSRGSTPFSRPPRPRGVVAAVKRQRKEGYYIVLDIRYCRR
jgi:hypothetical protein